MLLIDLKMPRFRVLNRSKRQNMTYNPHQALVVGPSHLVWVFRQHDLPGGSPDRAMQNQLHID